MEPSTSPWASPVVLAKKKDGSFRLCVDYRRLNDVTVSDAQPMGNLHDMVRGMKGARIFSTLDLKSGYWQLSLKPRARKYTAFRTKRGLFQFRVLLFGLKNSPATFVRLMSEVLKGLIGVCVEGYLDDIVIYSFDENEHLIHIEKVLERLQRSGLTCHPKKCHFGQTQISFLGHIIDANGIDKQPEKLEAILNHPKPTNIRSLRKFLGVCNWYCQFVHNYADVINPLTELLKKGVRWRWSEVEQSAFDDIRHKLYESPKLIPPDFSKPFCLQTDASEIGVGAILFQRGDDLRDRNIVAYASKKLSETQRRYAAVERECLGLIWAIDKFRPFLDSRPFELYTDNSALTWLHRAKDKNSKLTRWALQLGTLDFVTRHVPGTSNEGPDMLSRFPTNGPTLDEDRLEENLVGFPTSNKVVVREEPGQICHIHPTQISDSPISLQTLIDWQRGDPEIQSVVSLLIAGNPVVGTRQNQIRKLKNLVFEDDLLKKVGTVGNSVNDSSKLVVIPVDKQEHILWRYHDHHLAGHPGWKETYRAIVQRFYWKSVRESTRRYVAACHICACTKPLNYKMDVPLRPRKPTQPWEVISVDLMGAYPRTSRGKINILVATDCHSKWVEAYPLGAATTAVITQALERELFSRFGYPRVLLSDNGPQFSSDAWSTALRKWGVEGWTTPVYHPRANPVERRNQELKKGLRALLVEGNHRSWDLKLSSVLFTLRNRRNDRTGVPPSVIVLGREAKSPGDWELRGPAEPKVPKVREQPEKGQPGSVEKPRVRRSLSVGDWVYCRAHPLSKAEKGFHAGFAAKWTGPFRLKEELGRGVFLTEQNPPRKVHVSSLKICDRNRGVTPGEDQGTAP